MLYYVNFYTRGLPRFLFFSIILIFTVSSCGGAATFTVAGVPVASTTTNKNKQPTITTFTSEARLKEIGEEQHEDLLKTQSLIKDKSLAEYVRHVGSRVAKSSEKPDLDYQFFVLDAGGINAFAVPGGYIYVTRGLLGFLNSEAQLAAVLGHEIAHISARHHGRRGNRDVLGRGATVAGGVVAGVATGSSYAASQFAGLTSLWAQTATAGFGRELELEADGLSAEYLLASGYDPQAMFEVLTITKNQEDFDRVNGGGGALYHGSLASHPRTDRRLQEVIGEVGQLNDNEITQVDNKRFRENLDGLIFGESNASRRVDERNRYYQDSLGYTLVFPDDWQIDATTTTVTASAPNVGSLRVEAQLLRDNTEPHLFIRDKLGINNLQKIDALSQYQLKGHTGVAQNPESGEMERIAVIYLNSRAFIFRGEIIDTTEEEVSDETLLSSIRTFRKIQPGEVVAGGGVKIKFVQASEFFDFSVVAKTSKIVNYPEETLRLLNGYYPSGSPDEGDWIKLIE